MKLLSLIGASGLLLWNVGMARAETGPSPDTAATPGAVTTPSGAETPPPATYDNGTPATSPPGAELPQPSPTGTNNPQMTFPPPPNGAEAAPMAGTVPTPPPVTPVQPIYNDRDTGYEAGHVATHIGVGMLLGGGYERFTNNAIRNQTGEAGYWNVRVLAGTREFIGFEAAYVGDARGMNGLGFSNNARLISNGVEGVVRVNVPIPRGLSLVEPFGFIGLGWQHYNITNNNSVTSDVAAKDDVMTLPYGGGLEYSYRGFMADARFTYRQTYYNNLTSSIGGDLNNWSVGGQIGFEY